MSLSKSLFRICTFRLPEVSNRFVRFAAEPKTLVGFFHRPISSYLFRGEKSHRNNDGYWRWETFAALVGLGSTLIYLINDSTWRKREMVVYAHEQEISVVEQQKPRSILITPRQRLFFQFASVEYEGVPYMTPQDFLESVTEDHPRPRIRRKVLSKEAYLSYIKNTPARKFGSSRLFRNLEERGIISYSEYLFLLCVITRPKSNFQIAFNMFDTDGNQQVDKNEFLVVTKIFQRKSEPKPNEQEQHQQQQQQQQRQSQQHHSIKEKKKSKNKLIRSLIVIEPLTSFDTTLLVHLFGHRGNNVLKFDDFKRFMEDLQREILEIEFNEFSKGMNKITPIEFAEILLRYTDFSDEKRKSLVKNLREKIYFYSREITFEKFLDFSRFMMNLGDFQLALKFHTIANKPISPAEFQRAVKISSGFELDPLIIEVIFKVFDQNNDGNLSYREFIAVLKDRLNRGLKNKSRQIYQFSNYANGSLFQSANLNSQSDTFEFMDEEETLGKRFKRCIRKKMKERNYD